MTTASKLRKLGRVFLFILGGIAVVVLSATLVGWLRWRSLTSELRQRLETVAVAPPQATVDLSAIEDYPPPVRRYLRRVLTDKSPVPQAVRLTQTGSMNLGDGDEWSPFTADQFVVLRRPGFDWNAKVAIAPGLSVRVHDAYVGGRGYLEARILGLVQVAYLEGTGPIAEGELIRFLAETAWYPQILLPGNGIDWEPIDDRSARASLTDGNVVARLTFFFGEDELIREILADARGRSVDGQIVPTPWRGRFSDYVRHGNTLTPSYGEVAWVLPDGLLTYWRGHVDSLTTELPK